MAASREEVLQYHVSIPAVLFGDGQGAGIHVDVISAVGTGRYVGMTVEEDIAFVEWWQVVFVIDMAVGCENYRRCTSPQDRDIPSVREIPAPSGPLPYRSCRERCKYRLFGR